MILRSSPGTVKNRMIIGNRQLLPLPFFKPCFPVGFVAGGAASIFTGMIRIAQMITVAAPEEKAGCICVPFSISRIILDMSVKE
jgi:hypothetical protein